MGFKAWASNRGSCGGGLCTPSGEQATLSCLVGVFIYGTYYTQHLKIDNPRGWNHGCRLSG